MAAPLGFLAEHGFWDYTTPAAGGMEGYEAVDYDLLLEDMAGAGMSSVLVMVKWLTTGYRSRLPYLDQDPENPVTRSANRLLAGFLERAARAGLKTWLGAVTSMYRPESLSASPSAVVSDMAGSPLPFSVGIYDADVPQVTERSVAILSELAELFPGVTGLLVELEHSDKVMPHRIPLYDRWARENGRRPFTELVAGVSARHPDLSPWRDYTTSRRIAVLQSVEQALRSRGFAGGLAVLCETGALDYQVQQEVNLAMLKASCPGWVVVSYDQNYTKTRSRLGLMEMAVEEPKRAGLTSYYLPRGVMTWGAGWPLELSLERFWEVEIEDIQRFRPDGVWWFGSGTGSRPDGAHARLDRLRASGFEDGRAARRALLRRISGR